jgi:hypothetical protein
MSTEFGFIGWCNDPAANHDKVWGYFYRPTPNWTPPRWGDRNDGRNVVIFWARRGRAMQFKADTKNWELTKLQEQKQDKKDYRSISVEKLLEIWPTFIQECEAKLMWDVLAGKVK